MVHQNSICKTTAIAASFIIYSDSEHFDVCFFQPVVLTLEIEIICHGNIVNSFPIKCYMVQ